MKPLSLTALLALPLLLGPAATPADAAPAASPAAAAQDGQEFMEQFRRAMRVGATDEMNRLVKAHPEAAVFKIVEICEQIAERSNEQLEEEIAALSKAWKASFKSDFADEMYEYFSLLRPEIKDHRRTLTARYRVQNKEFIEAEKEGESNRFGEIGMIMKGLGESFEEIGDHYYASQAYLHWGKAFDEPLRGEDADLRQAHDGYLKAVQAREEVELKDVFYAQAKERQKTLEAMGFGDPAKGPKEPAKPKEGPTLTLETTFEMVEEIGAIGRPIYTADEIYLSWPNIALQGTGSTTTFMAMEDSPTIIRASAADALIDVDGDGEGDVEIPMTGNLMPVTLTLGSGPTERRWGFIAAVGGTRDTFNEIQYNASASDTFMSIYVAPAASVVADVGGTPVRIIDDNMDGIYGSDPIPWGHVGLVRLEENSENFQWDLDSVQIDGDDVARPWSEYLHIDGTWYRMEAGDPGAPITATPMLEMRTGELKLDMKGVDADFVVVRGFEGSDYHDSFFDVAADRGGIEVPVGRYELFVGRVSEGKKAQMAKALMVPGENTRTWTVKEGETTEMQLGEPFTFAFETTQDADTLTVIGDSVHVVGRGGEAYQRMWNCVPEPEVSIRPEGSSRGGEEDDMRKAGTQEELSDRGFQYAWFPFDLTLEKDKDGDHEAQLVEKKNELFGKIESEWR